MSFISIASISIDRFLVASPIKHRILMNGKVMVFWIAANWIVNCVVPLSLNASDVDMMDVNQGLSTCSVIILSSVMYSSTYYKLKKQSRNTALQNSNECRAQEIQILKEKRFLKTIIIIACIAFVCTIPFFVLYLLTLSFIVDDSPTFKIFFAVCTFIFHINFAVNH